MREGMREGRREERRKVERSGGRGAREKHSLINVSCKCYLF